MYAIKFTNAGGGNVGTAFPVTEGAFIPGAHFCSVIDTGQGFGYQNDPSALRVQFQAEIQGMDRVITNAWIRIYGITMDMIDQAADLTHVGVEVYGGFWPGLELASWEARYMGLLFQGVVDGAFGNWKGSDITLDIILAQGAVSSSGKGSGVGAGSAGPSAGGQSPLPPPSPSRLVSRQRRVGKPRFRDNPPPSAAQFDDGGGGGGLGGAIGDFIGGFAGSGVTGDPLKLIHDMKEGMPLDKAVKQTLEAAFPNSPIKMLMKEGMKLNYHDAGFYQSLTQHLGYAKSLSKDLAKEDKYAGATAYPIKDQIVYADGTKKLGSVTLDIIDLIGQPTWSGNDPDGQGMSINFMTPLRADLFPWIEVTLPNTLQFVGKGGGYLYEQGYPKTLFSGDRERLTFNGPVVIRHMMILGDSRNPQGESWALSCTGTPPRWGTKSPAGVSQTMETAAQGGFTPFPQTSRLTARSRRAGVGR